MPSNYQIDQSIIEEPGDSDEDRYKDWMLELKRFQESDLDMREQGREADRFLLDKDGQWEDSIRRQLDSQQRPRYTFDKVTPIIESIMADVENMDFGADVKPNGGLANKETALTLDGMIRTIQNMSRSDEIFRGAIRRVCRRGMDAWRIKAKFKDEWSFEQDLFIEAIPNSINRVWTSNTSVEADSSDSDVAYVLSSFSPDAYKKKWPEGSGVSVGDADIGEHWDHYRPEVVTVAERYFRKETKVEVGLLTNGEVVAIDDDWEKIKDEQAAIGITVSKTKKIKDYTWYHVVFDGGGILEKERATVFKSNPVITVYGNYEHLGENSKITWSGLVLKLMDAQRVDNYAESRDIEEGALAPRGKYWMTKKQAKGHDNQIARMNVSADPVQFYNPDGDAGTPPFYQGGAQPNPALDRLAQRMSANIKEQANVFDAMQGKFPARMSEGATRMQIDRGTASTRKWVNPVINGIRRTCELLIETMPVVYDSKRQFALMALDGSEEIVTLNEEIWDNESQTMVRKNILNLGKYKVTCDAGPAFANKLEAGLDAMLRYAEIDPSVVAEGGDIIMRAIDAPLVDLIADRKRAAMLQRGAIPVDQMTDDEKAQMEQASQQPDEPTPEMIAALAQADVGKAELMRAENDRMELQIEVAKVQVGNKKVDIDAAKAITGVRNTEADTAKKTAETEGQLIDNEIKKEEFPANQARADLEMAKEINGLGTQQ